MDHFHTVRSTKLQRFLEAEGIRAAAIERRSGMSRPTFLRVRKGRDVRLSTMIRILRAVRLEAGRRVRMDELFEIDPEE